jgi:hypothetical protein
MTRSRILPKFIAEEPEILALAQDLLKGIDLKDEKVQLLSIMISMVDTELGDVAYNLLRLDFSKTDRS